MTSKKLVVRVRGENKNYLKSSAALLDLAEKIEKLGIGMPWSSDATDLAAVLGVKHIQTPRTVSPEFLLSLHEALSRRLRDELSAGYLVSQASTVARLMPKAGNPQAVIVALHGANDRGLRFSGLFYELLCRHPLALVCPDSAGETWSPGDADNIVRLVEAESRHNMPVWIIGLSAGATLALSLRPRLVEAVHGVVAVGSSPSRMQCAPSAVPTLYIHGTSDSIFPIGELEAHLAVFHEPRSQLVKLDGWGHAFPIRILERYAWPWITRL